MRLTGIGFDRVEVKEMSEKKTDQAMRLFEAMEGVDPELLAKSEQTRKIIPFGRYARIAAACFAVLMLGGIGYVAVHVGGDFGHKAATESANYSSNGGAAGFAMDVAVGDGAAYGDKSKTENADDWGGAPGETVAMHEEAMEEYNGSVDKQVSENSAASYDTERENAGAVNAPERENADTAAIQGNENAVDGKRSESLNVILKEFLNSYSVNEKDDLKNKESILPLPRKQVKVVIGEEQIYEGSELAEQFSEFLQEFELEPVADGEGPEEFQPQIRITIVDGDGVISYNLSGNYVKMDGDEKIYAVLNENYDFEELREGLTALLQE